MNMMFLRRLPGHLPALRSVGYEPPKGSKVPIFVECRVSIYSRNPVTDYDSENIPHNST